MTASAEDGADLGNVDLSRGAGGDLVGAVILFAQEDGDLNAVDTANDVDNVVCILVLKAVGALVLARDGDVGDLSAAAVGNVRHGEGFGGERRFRLAFEKIAADLCVRSAFFDQVCGDLVRDGRGVCVTEAACVCGECRVKQGGDPFRDITVQQTVDHVVNDLRASSGVGIGQIIFREVFMRGMMVEREVDAACVIAVRAELRGGGNVYADVLCGCKIRRRVFDMKFAFAARHEGEGGGDSVAAGWVSLFSEYAERFDQRKAGADGVRVGVFMCEDEKIIVLQECFANSMDGDIIHKFDPSFPQNAEPSSSKESVAISSGMAAFFKSSEIFAPRSIALSYSKLSSGVMRRLIFSAIARRRNPAAL